MFMLEYQAFYQHNDHDPVAVDDYHHSHGYSLLNFDSDNDCHIRHHNYYNNSDHQRANNGYGHHNYDHNIDADSYGDSDSNCCAKPTGSKLH